MALQVLMGLVVANGLAIAALHWGMHKWVVPQVEAQRAASAAAAGGATAARPGGAKGKAKSRMSAAESFKFLASSPYIRDMATMVRAGACMPVSVSAGATGRSALVVQHGTSAGSAPDAASASPMPRLGVVR